MKNIIFIGMPGSGKSTLGVVLAKKLGYSFIDSDLVIQEKYGTTLERIIEKYGRIMCPRETDRENLSDKRKGFRSSNRGCGACG